MTTRTAAGETSGERAQRLRSEEGTTAERAAARQRDIDRLRAACPVLQNLTTKQVQKLYEQWSMVQAAIDGTGTHEGCTPQWRALDVDALLAFMRWATTTPVQRVAGLGQC